jgi:hypothetical protein
MVQAAYGLGFLNSFASDVQDVHYQGMELKETPAPIEYH